MLICRRYGISLDVAIAFAIAEDVGRFRALVRYDKDSGAVNCNCVSRCNRGTTGRMNHFSSILFLFFVSLVLNGWKVRAWEMEDLSRYIDWRFV